MEQRACQLTFQSSPALSSGRYLLGLSVFLGLSGFNPRPPFRAGATSLPSTMRSPMLVSILARPFERALRCSSRTLRGVAGFQSSPALSSGRYEAESAQADEGTCFNPRPPFRAGATGAHDHGRQGGRVSILARPFERALPATATITVRRRLFQSSPALSSGRYVESSMRPSTGALFQSSPALSSGRYMRGSFPFLRRILFQSSPALSSGRYRLYRLSIHRVCRFQSSPALSSGRYNGPPHAGVRMTEVSILARPFERALLAVPYDGGRKVKFQSSPALSSGRYSVSRSWLDLLRLFQSSPALSSGRYRRRDDHPARHHVSILARPFERALRPAKGYFTAARSSFNPRPPFRAGATRLHGWRSGVSVVSILARPFERALLSHYAPRTARRLFQSSPALSSGRYLRRGHQVGTPQRVSILARPFERALPGDIVECIRMTGFQSSPALSSGRYGVEFKLMRPQDKFQSSPALSSGRYKDRHLTMPARSCFNPRPPFRAGATIGRRWTET